MHLISKLALSGTKSQHCYRLFFCRKWNFLTNVNFVSLLRSDTLSTKYMQGHCTQTGRVLSGNICLNKVIRRFKTSKRRTKSTEKEDSDTSDDEDDDEEDDEESLSDIEPDYDAPAVYKHSFVHSLRADHLIAKGLAISKSEAERLFYSSKFLYREKTLLKKAKKLEVGDYIDVVQSKENDKLVVQRVKVIKILNRVTRKGKPVVAIRIWRKPFEIVKQQS
ncbi:uncharacterized protein LOC123551945 [Mercenaria mercenaria]|uniref:uncharacterized protein LOC123551945 n=1 Tax=Mercenaria mercenaria TaxID=6596 RepID=UPI00234E7117|nr:uncharacterized protein LOC123551945 [Mercenaria mercenaria]